MLKFNKKTEYAIIAVMDMAIATNGDLVTAKDLSQKYNLPRELLGKVLQGLARDGLIVSQQGVKGGYRLALAPDKIDFNLIIKATEGPIHLVDCGVNDDCGCNQLDYCNIKTPMEFIQLELTNFFKSITLKDFTEKYTQIKPLLQIQE
jgi:Rrf2 family protein